MRAMAGILPPTSGSIEVWGKASTLLALGVGFNQSLSGRENIILGGLASGLSRKEVEERADEVAEWTELGDFIDMPMRTYSSGMSARVGFSVAVHMKPDILMIDEALSTGDAHFREKANAKMAELRESARAMFLVSHGLGSIKEMCSEAIWLDKGKLMMRGEPDEVVTRLHEVRQGQAVGRPPWKTSEPPTEAPRLQLSRLPTASEGTPPGPRISPSRPPLPTISGGADGFSFTPEIRSRSPPGTVSM